MKKYIKSLAICLIAVPLFGCSQAKASNKTGTHTVLNGGFETSDLSGWTVEYGDAFTDDSVSSRTHFSFSYDEQHNQINNNKTGNWYLSGQGFDLSYSHGRIGAIRSNNFYLTKDGQISMKFAGGALTKGKGEDAEYAYHLCLMPAAELKVMMDRCHPEHSLAACLFEICDLDDNGQCLNNVDETGYRQEPFHMAYDRHSRKHSAECH